MEVKLTEAELKDLMETLPVDGERYKTAVSLLVSSLSYIRIFKVLFSQKDIGGR
jgi:hypothetical protein